MQENQAIQAVLVLQVPQESIQMPRAQRRNRNRHPVAHAQGVRQALKDGPDFLAMLDLLASMETKVREKFSAITLILHGFFKVRMVILARKATQVLKGQKDSREHLDQ